MKVKETYGRHTVSYDDLLHDLKMFMNKSTYYFVITNNSLYANGNTHQLSKREHKIGSPERPISDLGIKGYHSYWKRTILKILQEHTTNLYKVQEGASSMNGDETSHNDNGRFMITINEISLMTSIRREDIICTLQEMGFLKYRNPNGNGVNYATITNDVNNHAVNGTEQHDHHEQQTHNNSPQQAQYQLHLIKFQTKNKRKLALTIENGKKKEATKKTPGELLKNSKKVTKELQERTQKGSQRAQRMLSKNLRISPKNSRNIAKELQGLQRILYRQQELKVARKTSKSSKNSTFIQ
ncbi:3048_t:CDS:2 [Racocetra fulgida]|uniref:histone acetyltransferase n=1 Tax=Racocetra fulgida TaxID=60492 RepID=A0A9N9A6M8_9GLOM|nr:3048_t:CDS:2 [Racocetra fulgida]